MSLAFAGFHIVLFAVQLAVFPLWGAFATFDEQLQLYQGGRNFARHGFAATAWLPDLSTASDPAEHPVVYNHQPPGPQLLLGVMIRVLGERYDVIRALLVLVFTAGLLAYLRFLRLLDGGTLPGTSGALLLLTPQTLLHAMDHPDYSLFPLFAFLPVLAFARGARTAGWWWRGIAGILVFAGTSYLPHGPLLMIYIFWLVAALTGLVPLTRRDLVVVGAAAVLAGALHITQTIVLMGPAATLREFAYTVSNRMIGRPSRGQLEEFYASWGLVLYGGHEFSLVRLVIAMAQSLLFSGTALVVIGMGVAAAARFAPRLREAPTPGAGVDARRLLTAGAAAVPAVILPSLAFPAFASDYGLQGTGEFLLAIVAASGILVTSRIGMRLLPAARRVVMTLLAVGLAVAILAQAASIARVVRRTAIWAQQPDVELGLTWVRRHLHGQPVMTNIDPIALGFLTEEVAVGGCHRPAVPGPPDPAKCAIRHGRDGTSPRWAHPRAYVWVGVGNRFCSSAQRCIERSELDRAYPPLFSNRLVAVYDLTRQ